MSDIAAAFRAACAAELDALKPGNVHRFAEGHGMSVADLERSAEVAAPAIAEPSMGVGERVLAAARATRAAVGQNTNLGILLLCAPLARAAELAPPLPVAMRRVLRRLDLADAVAAFAAIRLAAPGGLGTAETADVRHEPTIGLLEAMRLAAARDRIAWNYAHGLADVFRRGLPRLAGLRARGWPEPWAVSGVHMGFMAAEPDSHVARKHGAAEALALRHRVRPLARAFLATAEPAAFTAELLALDATLKARGLNPGTSADLTVATCFAARLMRAARLGPEAPAT
jgi:triphosphoribosyl-dephospho-CoA synthase